MHSTSSFTQVHLMCFDEMHTHTETTMIKDIPQQGKISAR